MDSIILIGDKDFNINKIINVEFKHAKKSYFASPKRFIVEYDDGHIVFEVPENIIDDYEKEELKSIPFKNPRFITMSSSSFIKIKEVLISDGFLSDIYIDNDHGAIMSMQDFVKKVKYEPEWDIKQTKKA